MQQQTAEPPIGVRFREAFNLSTFAYHAGDDGMGNDDMWGYRDGEVALLGPDTTEFGVCDVTGTHDARYDRTDTLVSEKSDGTTVKRRCYVFDTPFGETWVNVAYVRTLANEVFNVSYDDMKVRAVALDPDDVYAEGYDGTPPLLFPHDGYTAFVAPLRLDE